MIDPLLSTEALIAQANQLRIPDLMQAQAYAELAVAKAEGQPALLAQALQIRGRIYSSRGLLAQALEDALNARQLFGEQGDEFNTAVQDTLIGNVYIHEGLYTDALTLYLQALPHIEHAQSTDWYTRLLNNLGYAYVQIKMPDKAAPFIERCVALARQHGHNHTLAMALDSLARAYMQQGRFADARQLLGEALFLFSATDTKGYESLCELYLSYASSEAGLGNLPEALHLLDKVQALAREHGRLRQEADALYRAGALYRQHGRCEAALGKLMQALALLSLHDMRSALHECDYEAAMCYQALGDYQLAFEHFQRFHQGRERAFTQQFEARMKHVELMFRLHQAEREREYYRETSNSLAREVERRSARLQEAEQQANTDMLTGLPNRHHFWPRADALLAETGRWCSLIILDADHFKQVNDRFGHLAGDQVLRGIGELLAAEAREGDLYCRFGGEEFVLLLPATRADGAAGLAQRLLQLLPRREFSLLPGRPVTLSAGVAELYVDGQSSGKQRLRALLGAADQALYRAKEGGRNQVCLATVQGVEPAVPTEVRDELGR
jgi:diguanylate cyclase (GGDEF)-like protein